MKLPIKGSDFSNVVGETLLQSLPRVNDFLRILQDFRGKFLKEHLKKANSATFHQIRIKALDLKSSF